jgi:hypothetical protein
MTFAIQTKALSPSSAREELFSIDGTSYTIPKDIGGEIGLRATKIATESGEMAATMYCIEQTIGMDAYDALCKVDGLPKKTLGAILAVCREKVFGGMEEEGKG